jgi:hypothetical protein
VAAPAEAPLAQLVRDELRGPVSELVRKVVVELVHEQLNGYGPAPVETEVTPSANGAAPSTKVCTLCGETKPSSAFNAGRRQCRNARYPRSRRARGTATAATAAMASDEEPPRTGSAESGSEAQRLPA